MKLYLVFTGNKSTPQEKWPVDVCRSPEAARTLQNDLVNRLTATTGSTAAGKILVVDTTKNTVAELK